MKTAFIASILAMLLVIGPAQASSLVKIEGDDPQATIVVHPNGDTVDNVIEALGRKFGFEVALIGAPRRRAVHGIYSGPLETVLRRIMRQDSFLVIRDPAPIVGHDFLKPKGPQRIKMVKLIGSGGNRTVVRSTASRGNGRSTPTASQRARQYNTAPASEASPPPENTDSGERPRIRYGRGES
jgi:hypothetical protein